MKLTKGKINKIKKRERQSKKRNNRHRNKDLVKHYNDQSFRKKRHINLKNKTLKRFGIFGGDVENDDKTVNANRIGNDDDDSDNDNKQSGFFSKISNMIKPKKNKSTTNIDNKPAVEPVVEPAVEPVVEPVVEPAVEPVVEPVVEPAVKPVVETAVEPAVKPAVEPAVEPVVETAVKPVVEPVVKPAVETVVEPVIEPVDATNKNEKTEPNNEVVHHIPDNFGPATSMEEVADYFANVVLLKLVSKFDVNTNMNFSDLMHTLANKNNNGMIGNVTSNTINTNNGNNGNYGSTTNDDNNGNTTNDVKSFFDNINTNFNTGVNNNNPTNNPNDLNFTNGSNVSKVSNEYPSGMGMGMGAPIGMDMPIGMGAPMGTSGPNNEEKFENKQRKDETYGEYLNRVEAHENTTGEKIVRQEPKKETGEAYGASLGVQSEREKAQHKADLEAFCRHEPSSQKCSQERVNESNVPIDVKSTPGNTIEDDDAPRFVKETDRPQTIEKIEPTVSNTEISGSRINSDIDEGSKRLSTRLNEGAEHVKTKLNEGVSHVGAKLNEGVSHVGAKLNEGASHIKNMGKSGLSSITRRFGRRGGNSHSNKTKKHLTYN